MLEFRSALLALALLAPLSSCKALGELLGGEPTARISDVSVGTLGLQASTLVFDVEVRNPYGVALPLTDLGYRLTSGGQALLGGDADIAGTVPARGTRTVQIPVEVGYLGVMQALEGIRPGAVVPYEAHLDLSVDAPAVGKLTLPIDREGTLPIPALPKVSVASMDWSELGLLGAKGTIALDIENTNQFPVDLDTMSYGLSLGGRRVFEGRIAESLSFDQGGKRRLEIPVSLSTTELGGGIISILRGAEAQYQVEGDVAIGTPWGKLAAPFSSIGTALSKR